ncbi:hypothetical protein [Prosthecobacter sp.]|uniref:hypothetical protein n=1 Tax=Prosthecobacter sp. TaxID=1965333 RepID=UPI001DD681FD|nr:hypothetical protein [Prosthecobacter sp.]MCB1278011.1 hypothetical protein [Prosthecobacter sp.]
MPPALNLDNKMAGSLLQVLSIALREEDQSRVELAQNLHRDVSGSMVACTSLGEMIRHEIANGGDLESACKLLGSLDAALREALQHVRDLQEKQYPPVLKVFGLAAALQQLVRTQGANFAGSIVLQINGEEPKFDIISRLNLFRLMESLLRHFVHHSGTSWVEVVCLTSPDHVEVTIDHDGDDGMWSLAGAGSEVARIEARCLLLGARIQVTRNGAGGNFRVSLTAHVQPAVAPQ